MPTPDEILDLAFHRASQNLANAIVHDADIVDKVEYICRNVQNQAGKRLLLACLLAKVHLPDVDVRKPYTEIGGVDSYSGRTYDEAYVSSFINQYQLPCNPTTAFLTPALRNRNIPLTVDIDLVGRPPKLYQAVLQLFDDVQAGKVRAEDLLIETIRWLIVVRDEERQRTTTLLASLKTSAGGIPLSSEAIVNLIEQHLSQPRSSRLPVLVVAAAYQAASDFLRERVLPLEPQTYRRTPWVIWRSPLWATTT